jgi:hypothetical protein
LEIKPNINYKPIYVKDFYFDKILCDQNLNLSYYGKYLRSFDKTKNGLNIYLLPEIIYNMSNYGDKTHDNSAMKMEELYNHFYDKRVKFDEECNKFYNQWDNNQWNNNGLTYNDALKQYHFIDEIINNKRPFTDIIDNKVVFIIDAGEFNGKRDYYYNHELSLFEGCCIGFKLYSYNHIIYE